MIKNALGFAALIFVSTAALANDKPVISMVDGQPVVATYSTGDEATLKVTRDAPISVRANFTVSENSCANVAGQTFYMNLGLQIPQLGFVWTKHKDPKKIGKVVQTTNMGGGTVGLSLALLRTNDMAINSTVNTKDLPRDMFTFTDVSWIPGMQDGVKRSFSIDTWLTENMVTNPQTGIDENRIVASFSGIHTSLDSSGVNVVDKIDGKQRVASGGSVFALMGDVVTWIFSANGNACQISLKPDKGGVNDQVAKYFNSLSDKYLDYAWNEDDLTKEIGGKNSFLFFELEQADD